MGEVVGVNLDSSLIARGTQTGLSGPAPDKVLVITGKMVSISSSVNPCIRRRRGPTFSRSP